MFRTLMTTTAFVALLSTGAIAQDAPATDAPAMDAPAATDTAMPMDSSILASGYTVTDKDNLATEIIGKQVYGSAASDAEHIGDINNLVIGENGEVAAVVIGVGGFLGIGEKSVAVNYSELEWVMADDQTERYVLATTKEALESAPDFKTTDEAMADNGAMTNNDGMATNDAMAPADTTDPLANPVDANAMDNTVTPADQTMTPIDRTTLNDVPLTAEELIGTDAYGPADEHLGAVGDVILGDDGQSVDAVIIDFGGFLGIGAKPVAVGVENMRFATDVNGGKFLFLDVTREQLDNAAIYDEDTYLTERDTQRLQTGAM